MIELSTRAFEVLRKDEEFILYRGRGQGDPRQLLVLSPLAEHPRPEGLRRLEHECSLRGELDPAWAVRPIAIARYWDRAVLVLEDPGGVPLESAFGRVGPAAVGTDGRDGDRLELTFYLRVAISLATAIGRLHQRGIIHKDIKPAHVVVNPETGECRLTGFGIASRLPRERQSPEPPEIIAGTLAYMAPEQTGRMNRSIDFRSDLGGKVAEITLGPLSRAHLGQLVADALRCERELALTLAQLVHEKTGGNPFFAIQFISSLAEERMLIFDHDTSRWSWDLGRIHAKGYTDNVVDLMVGKLVRLPAETQKALQQLACLGNVADTTMLSIVLGLEEDQLHAALWPSVRQELVDRLAGAYRFVHDRVQEAAYSLIAEGHRSAAHLRIGRLLAERTPREKREEAIFDIVSQLNRGAALITSPEERVQLAELNWLAGKRAKASSAYVSALNYLATGAALLPPDSWEHHYELIFALELHRSECEILTGGTAMEQRLLKLSDRARSIVDLAAVTSLQQVLYTTRDRLDQSVQVGLNYLRKVGINWTAHPTKEEVDREYEEPSSRRPPTLPTSSSSRLCLAGSRL